MPLLQSGKIYEFSIPFIDANNNQKDLDTLRQEFINKYKSVTKITDPDYSTLFSTYIESCEVYFLILPYINDPINTTKGKLFINLLLPPYNLFSEENSYYGLSIVGSRGSMASGGDISFADLRYDTLIKLNNNAMAKYKNSSEFESYEKNSQFFPDLSAGKNVSGFCHFRIDTRFLASHRFYTINSLYCETENELDKIYFSPTTIICDMEDQITGQHYDAAFALQTNGCMWDLNDQSEYGTANYNMLAGLGIGFDSDNEPLYANNSFFPQIWDTSNFSALYDFEVIRLHRLRFGRLKSNNIYLINAAANDELVNLVNFNKMSTYDSEWLSNTIYTDTQNFILGVSSLLTSNTIYNIYRDRSQAKFQFIIAATEIETKGQLLVPWPTGIDEDVTDMINNFYDGNLSLSEIETQWNVNDKRILSDWMEMATNIEGSGDEQTKMTITEFVDNDNNNEVILYY